MKNLPEILSPVGNSEMLFAAVRAGADAVYLGAKDFNARRNADNFDGSSLKEAIDYCHIRGVKVYLTLNILIKDSEINKALSLAFDAYNMGIDGIIIADLGLARILHKTLPQLPLHASTQMTVCHEDALLPLKEVGFRRVVAAREMSKAELISLCNKAKELQMEIEVFVHGALCMCMSGQCLLSALLGGRSGNRGLCAGPCRLPFNDGFGNDYSLSLKDLSMLPHISTLQEMGVASFKIEGRMKRPEYVAAATAAVHSMLNKGYIEDTLKDCAQNVFSRSGFTDGYFNDNLGKNMFGMRTKEDVSAAADTYAFLHEMIRRERSSVGIKISAEIKANTPIKITVSDNKNTLSVYGEIPEKARNKPTDKDVVISSLSKLGSTPYFIESISVILDEGLSVRSSALNELRRKACCELDKKRCHIDVTAKMPEYSAQNKFSKPKKPVYWLSLPDLSYLPSDVSAVQAVILPIEKQHDLSVLKNHIMPIADIPRAGLFGKQLKAHLEKAKNSGFKAVMVNNIGHLPAVSESGLTAFGGMGLNLYSCASFETAKAFSLSGGVVSPELTLNLLNGVNVDGTKICFAYGRLPLMLTKNCPASLNGCEGCKKDRFLTDRKGIKFPVSCRMGYSELFADRPIWLADKADELDADVLLLSFTFEEKQETDKILNAYIKGDSCKGSFTRGLYTRGVE